MGLSEDEKKVNFECKSPSAASEKKQHKTPSCSSTLIFILLFCLSQGHTFGLEVLIHHPSGTEIWYSLRKRISPCSYIESQMSQGS